MRYVPPLNLDIIKDIAKQGPDEILAERVEYNARFAEDLSVYQEILGPSILIPEKLPKPEQMSEKDFEQYMACDNIEEVPEGETILRYCKAFTILQTKQVGAEEWEERRPIRWPEKLNQDLQECIESDINLKKPSQKIEQAHKGEFAVCEDLTHSFHQVELKPPVRNLFGIYVRVGNSLRLVRVKRLPMGFMKAADMMDAFVEGLASAVTALPQENQDVHVDNFRVLGHEAEKVQEAQDQFREACRRASVTLNNEPDSKIHSKGKHCGIVFDYINKTAKLKETFPPKVKAGIHNMREWNMKDVRTFFGKLFHGAEVLAAPVWRWYAAVKFYRRRMASDLPDAASANVWPCSIKSITEWASFVIANEERPIPNPGMAPQITAFTDAAKKGWGVVLIEENTGKVQVFGGRFPAKQAEEEHINVKEARAVEISLKILKKEYQTFPQSIKWMIDNTSALGAIRKGRSRTFALNRVISEIRDMIPPTTTTKFEYVPSSLNMADDPSRGKGEMKCRGRDQASITASLKHSTSTLSA